MVHQVLWGPTRLDRHRPLRGRTVTAHNGTNKSFRFRFVKERNWTTQTAL
jgi:hypothetical protein